eukprot:m.228446 g.228446  ORF g.228446 m.228446 type:complete len:175 (+) comp11742_c0_seq1:140-664(+)
MESPSPTATSPRDLSLELVLDPQRSKIENLLQVAAALEPQKPNARAVPAAATPFAGQDADQIRRLRRKLLSREYSRRYRMRIREKIGMMKGSPIAPKADSVGSSEDGGDGDVVDAPSPPQVCAPVGLDSVKALVQAANPPVPDNWDLFVQGVQRLSGTPEGRRAVILLSSGGAF